jgi:hypothetical protein
MKIKKTYPPFITVVAVGLSMGMVMSFECYILT